MDASKADEKEEPTGGLSQQPRGEETWGLWGQLRSSPRPLLQGVSRSSSGEESPAGLEAGVWVQRAQVPNGPSEQGGGPVDSRSADSDPEPSQRILVSGVPPYSIARGGEDRGPSLPPQEIYAVRLLQRLCRQAEEEPEPAGFLWPALSQVCLGRDRVCWREKGFWVPPRGV